MNSATSMAAIAAASLPAATPWWAAHGLLPVCAPLDTGSTCAPASSAAVPPMENGQTPTAKTERKDNTDRDLSMQDQQLDPEYSGAMQGQHSASKSPTSSSDCEDNGDPKVNTDVKAAADEKAAAVTEPQDANQMKNRKQVYCSSRGSNTPSTSEVEIDVLGKRNKDKEDSKGADAKYPRVECTSRRGRISSNLSDSLKEVSEEGRLAFRAIFSREVLPQSFYPPHDGKGQRKENVGEDKQNPDENDGETSTLDLNGKTLGSCSDHQEAEKNALSRAKNIVEESLPTTGLGHAKLKALRTGFKPYKRCSVEAKESRVKNTGCQGEEKGPKRIRLEEETST